MCNFVVINYKILFKNVLFFLPLIAVFFNVKSRGAWRLAQAPKLFLYKMYNKYIIFPRVFNKYFILFP